MYPEDRVLVGVMNRKRDFERLRTERWYRIPQARLPRGVNAEYIALYFSRAFQERNGGIYYFAERRGLELAYRRDLLPDEGGHPRAADVYYKIQLGDLIEKAPPVLNPSRRVITFIYTTWDRFVSAATISDLYSQADYFVDRIFYALRSTGVAADRTWEAEYRAVPPQLRILCQRGTVTASTQPGEGMFFLDTAQPEDAILAAIRAEITRHGGPLTISIPLEGA